MNKNLLAVFAVAILFAAIGIYVSASREPTAGAAAPARPVNAQQLLPRSLPDAEGRQHDLSQWQGKNLVLNFWATWCGPCVEEMPELNALQAEMASRNTQILGIGIDTASNIQEFSAKYQISYPLFVAGMEGTELARAFGNQAGGLPFTVLIGADGKVRQTYLGRLKMDELRRDLARLQG